ncbi:uncharacterized protein LOC118433820 [Folsomia candida]|uniref:uncharacterized protein LOC118433820 n=1 Tax=Folsomia candida TaxID=158441 RepID=UPI00160505F9|nr:uncharacterized protein LOC118433820 [Folsomia candida]
MGTIGWIISTYFNSFVAKLQLLEDDIELPRRIQERSHQPTLFFYRNDDGCLQAELLENGTDTKTVHEIVHIPLVNTDGEEEASVIGRSSEDPLRTGINRAGKVEKSAMDEGNVCSARRVLKYGVQYSPNDARSTNVATNEDDIADLLKRFTRIFLNAISSYKPSECLEKLANFEEVLRDHLMQQKKFFPPSTVKYMESWGDGPMIGDWNLLALELQLPHPNPAHYISVPMSTFQNLMEILIYDENANQLVDELDLCAESAKALLAKAQLQARPAVNPFWFSKEKMMKKGKVAKAVELVKVGHSELDAAAQMGIPRRTVELEMKKDGVKSKFRPGRQPSTRYTSTQMTAAVELVREGKTYDEARSPFKIPKQSLQDACKRLGVKSARAYKKNRL